MDNSVQVPIMRVLTLGPAKTVKCSSDASVEKISRTGKHTKLDIGEDSQAHLKEKLKS